MSMATKFRMMVIYKAYGHQILQSGDLLREASTHKVTQPIEHVATWDRMINQKLDHLVLQGQLAN